MAAFDDQKLDWGLHADAPWKCIKMSGDDGAAAAGICSRVNKIRKRHAPCSSFEFFGGKRICMLEAKKFKVFHNESYSR